MSLTQQDITALTDLLRNGENLDDLLSLLNAIVDWQNSSHHTKRFLFTRKQLSFFYRNVDSKYSSFQIAKKSGGFRSINAPYKTLKAIQRCIADLLQAYYEPPFSVNGFVTGRSVVSNAQVHTSRNFVLNIDLQDFFPSIKFGRISTVLQLKPVLAKPRFAYLLTKFCCQNGVLPQGSPTSPVLSNLICHRLDNRLFQLTRSNRITYTRYADDLSFSSDQPFQNGFLSRLEEIIQEEGFAINPIKARLLDKTMRQEVTGVTVNERANVSRKFVREVRAMLHNWATLGYDLAQDRFISSYKAPLRQPNKFPQLSSVVGGKINYLKMIRGASDSLYRDNKAIYEQLLKGESVIQEIDKPLLTYTLQHNPRQVVTFLRNFKIVNSSGFRELLHDPDDSNFDFEANLSFVNQQMATLSQVLPDRLYFKLASLVEVYNIDGLAYFKKHGLLPLKGRKINNSSSLSSLLSRKKKSNVTAVPMATEDLKSEVVEPDERVTHATKLFRIQIRVGNDYFQNLVLVNALKPAIDKLNEANNLVISYHPDEDKFGLNCEFYTDAWEVRTAIRSLLKDLAYNTYYRVQGKRVISLRSALIKRQTDQETFYATVIYLQLTNAFLDDAHRAFSHNRLVKTQQRLRMLADWSITYQDDNGEPHEHFFLASSNSQFEEQPAKGTIHKLTFYHS